MINTTMFIKKYTTPFMWTSGILALVGFIFLKLLNLSCFANLIFILAMLLSGLPILLRAIQGLRHKTVGIECLVCIAVIGACIIKEFSEAAVVTFLFQLGSYLEQRTIKKTRSAIRTLTEMAPVTACRIVNGTVGQIDVDDVETGDELLVKTGAQIPVDGVITEGEGYVNESSITGESALCKKTKDSFVYAGSILDSGTLQMQASKVGEDTTFAKIISMVEEAQDAKSAAEQIIDRFARHYTPFVVLLAILTFLLSRNLDTSITILVLACPGALVIGAPLANVAGIGRGAQEKILLKGGESINTFAKTDIMIFDKTGTLTIGKPMVTQTIFFNNSLSENERTERLSMIASAETASDHPLAQAIVRYVKEQGIPVKQALNVTIEKGLGICASVDGKESLIGSQRLMDKHQICCNSEVIDISKQIHANGATLVLAAIDHEPIMAMGISDAVKKDALSGLNRLKELGIKRLIMLTGDHADTAEMTAKQLGITEVHGELLPEDKVHYIKSLQRDGHTVTFVGDGINDSPALATADTGIAMGSGTDVAIDTSDVVLIRSNLESLAAGYQLSGKIVKIMYQNIAIAVGTVILLLLGLWAGYIHLAIGMLIHEGSILVVILNSMKLMIRRKNDA